MDLGCRAVLFCARRNGDKDLLLASVRVTLQTAMLYSCGRTEMPSERRWYVGGDQVGVSAESSKGAEFLGQALSGCASAGDDDR